MPSDLSPGLAQVVKLAEANVGDDVILAYLKNSGEATVPTADEILYLKDLGVSDAVITALLQSPTPSTVPPPAPAPVTPPPVQVVTAPPTETVTTAYFEEQLSPYGSWVEIPEYGRCWQPAVVAVNHEWRPYSDRGHWVYTDAGWFWQSDYTWGWAAFHYGRWFNHGRYGWVWAPDSVWGPSWVCWRQNDTHCGWAPLPPGARFETGVGLFWHNGRVSANFDFGLNLGWFTVVGFDHFCDRDVHRYYVPRREAVNVYNRTTVINNYTIVNKTVVNEGFGRDRVVAVSHKEVPRVVIHETTTVGPGRVNHATANNGGLTVFRPTHEVMASHVAVVRQHPAPVIINRSTPPARATVNERVNNTQRSSVATSVTTERSTQVNRGNPASASTRTETTQPSRNVVVHHDAPVGAPAAPINHSTSRIEPTVSQSRATEPSPSARHGVEHPAYQPRGWSGNSESVPSVSHNSTASPMSSPHQSAAPSVGRENAGRSYSAPASSSRSGSDKPR